MRQRPCSISEHGRIAADPERFRAECTRHRRWSELDLTIAEHNACGSTLAREQKDAR